MKLIDLFTNLFSKVENLPEGTYHLQALTADQKPYRLHLRMGKDGAGILILNASTVLHLNPTAAEFAYHYIKGAEPIAAAKEISRRYRISVDEARDEYEDFAAKILTLVQQEDLDPVLNLGFDSAPLHSAAPGSPLRMDLALTYQLPAGMDSIYAPTERVREELSSAQWQQVIDLAWAQGVPHVVFTGGEPTLRDDLPELIAHAEKNGQVTGLLTDGRRLADPAYLAGLLNAGLDHLMILFPTRTAPDWKLIEHLVSADIFLTVHITLTPANSDLVEEQIDTAAGLGVRNISLCLSDPSLREDLLLRSNQALSLGMRLVSDLPVPYSESNPAALEGQNHHTPVGMDGFNGSGAGKSWFYVEPDGDVLPAQGCADQVLGNILEDDWAEIFSVAQPA